MSNEQASDPTTEPATHWETVRDRELAEIAASRRKRLGGGSGGRRAGGRRRGAPRIPDLLGLAFSGGGIRSATFNLGVLQGLARLGLLKRLDYLSTVSGGGYIGSWLVAWASRIKGGVVAVERALCAADGPADSCPPGGPVQFLRRFSNYLTPRLGLLSADTWTVVATYLRNLTLNLATLTAFLTGVLLIPRCVALATHGLMLPTARLGGVGAALALLGLAAVALGWQITSTPAPGATSDPPATGQGWAQWTIVTPLVLAAFAGLGWFWSAQAPLGTWVWKGAVVYALVWVPALLFALGGARGGGAAGLRRWLATWCVVLAAAAAAGAAGGILLWLLAGWAHGILPATATAPPSGDPAVALFTAFGVPLLLAVFLATGVLHTGLMGWRFPDPKREWWSRLGAWVLIYGLAWTALFGAAFYGPSLVQWLRDGFPPLLPALATGWVGTTAAGLLAARSPRTAGEKPNPLLEVLAKAAPYVFIAGFVSSLAYGIHRVVPPPAGRPGDSLLVLVATVVSFALAAYLSWRVNLNEFSMHPFYRNRLVRAYLGASNPRRRAEPFTGFDAEDDVRLAHLVARRSERQPVHRPGAALWSQRGRAEGAPPPLYVGPYPIFNAGLNLVAGSELAWQERRAASFVFTPLYCGFVVPQGEGGGAPSKPRRGGDLETAGFRPTIDFAYPGGGVRVGTAMAISGAAASPNMGYHSSAALAFLMTVFNVRLGWWLGNPRRRSKWMTPGPIFGLTYLVAELLGFTNSEARYVYLSDGGHFENLGVYELVRRRCRFIIACDAEADPTMAFSALGRAIRQCRIDLATEIDIDVSQLRLDPATGKSRRHCAVGWIRYPGDAQPAVLLYLKASLTGEEDEDVANYLAENPTFPHETTADQFFSESQFESYRRLGFHTVLAAFNNADRSSNEALFQSLREAWPRPSSVPLGSFARLATELDALFEQLRADRHLRFLDEQIYPEWRAVMAGRVEGGPLRLWLPQRYEEIRQGFYFCTALIQLMENVYLDLDLERENDLPDNRGWINLFHHWSWSGMFRVTWVVTIATYGSRFQRFCELQLGLADVGIVTCDDAFWAGASREERLEVLAAAGGEGLLNFYEVALIEKMLASGVDDLRAADRLFVLQQVVEDPAGAVAEGAAVARLRLTFGFALARGDRLLFFRVQDHVRGMGLARKALRELIRQGSVRWFGAPEVAAEELPEFPTPAQCERFGNLVDSVRREVEGWSD